MALRGATAKAVAPRTGVVCSAIEHHAVLNTAKAMRDEGRTAAIARVDEHGVLDLTDLAAKVDDTTAVVSVMLANNETGALQPVPEAAGIARAHGALVHCDAVQAAGKVPVDVRALDVDLLTLSAHKLYGPKGVGCLYVRRGTRMAPLVRGGGQERNRRAGTENVAGLVGFGVAAALAREGLEAESSPPRGPPGPARGAAAGHPGSPSQRRRAQAAEHGQPVVRGHRVGGAAHRPRPRGHRGLDGGGLRRGRGRAVPRAPRHGPPARARPVLAAPLPRPRNDRGRRRPRRRRHHPRRSPQSANGGVWGGGAPPSSKKAGNRRSRIPRQSPPVG